MTDSETEDLLGPIPTTTSSRYWRGEGSDLGHVKAIPQNTFQALVDEVINAPSMLNMTREEYHNLDKKAQDKAKRVRYLTPAKFNSTVAKRRYENAASITLICLDIDDSDHARPYVSAPETLEDQLEGLNFVIYTTASSTLENPRVRIMVDAANFPNRHYVKALNDVAIRIGLPKVTKESKPHVQAMYLPTMFKADSEELFPVLWSVTNKRAYTLDDIKHSNTEHENQPLEFENTSNEAIDLELLRAPVEDVTLQDAASALQHVDPDIDYHEWLKIATGLKHQFQKPNQRQAAYELFDEWSSKGEKYQGSKETLCKWRSFNITPKNRLPITIRTVFKIAGLNGWDSHYVRLRCFNTARDWIQSDQVNDTDIIAKGIKKISEVPLLTKSQEEVLLRDLVKRMKKAKYEVSLPTVRKEMTQLRAKEKANSKDKKKFPAWTKDFCYLSGRNKFFKITTREYFSPEALDKTYGKELLGMFEEADLSETTEAKKLAKPSVLPQDYLLNMVEIPRPYEVLYDPQNPNDRYVREDGKLFVNTYVNNHPQPDVIGADEAGTILLNHMDKLIAEKSYRRVILDFMAYCVQYPGHKIRWAILLQGVEGCGKTFVVEALNAVLGQGHTNIVDLDAIKSGWNDWAYGSQVVAIEEVRVSGQNRHEIMNSLKPLITNDRISVNERFVNSKVVWNNVNYMLFTNYHDALALTDNDRRYFIVKSQMQTKDDKARLLPEGYFKKLFGMLKDNAGGLRYFLENWPISKTFDPDGDAPSTIYKTEVIEETGGLLTKHISDIIKESSNEWVQPDIIATTTLKDMLAMAGENATPHAIAAALRSMGYVSGGRRTTNVGEERQRVWIKKEPLAKEGSELL